jgi:hypothetical protein
MLIHIAYGGPDRYLSVGCKQYRFEDHPYSGPIVLCRKTGEISERQPPANDRFWLHVNAWYQQGKKVKEVEGKAWCIYETPNMEARRLNREARAALEEST